MHTSRPQHARAARHGGTRNTQAGQCACTSPCTGAASGIRKALNRWGGRKGEVDHRQSTVVVSSMSTVRRIPQVNQLKRRRGARPSLRMNAADMEDQINQSSSRSAHAKRAYLIQWHKPASGRGRTPRRGCTECGTSPIQCTCDKSRCRGGREC